MSLKILITLGSVRPNRMADRVSSLVQAHVKKQAMNPVVLDPMKIFGAQMVRQPMHFISPEEETPAWMHTVHNEIKNADGFILLSSEYNCGIPPALPNLLNSFPPTSYRHRPCGIVTYSIGPFAGMRSLTLLRPYIGELGMICVPTYAPIPTVGSLIEENGQSSSQLVNDKIKQVVAEVKWYAEAFNAYKKSVPLPNA